jgi:hypothetical protein
VNRWLVTVSTCLLLVGLVGCSINSGVPYKAMASAVYRNPELRNCISAASGFHERNATEAIQRAIDSGAENVVIPNMGKPWYVDPIVLKGDQTVILEEGVVVAARKGSFREKHSYLFSAVNQSNISIFGYGAVLQMRKDEYRSKPYAKSEWRHAISLKGCSNVAIEGLTIRSSGGDGIYIGRGRGDIKACEDVRIRNVLLEDHYRQGISVVSVKDLLIENVQIYGTGGTPPSAGIDFEPNNSDEVLQNCRIQRCRIQGNRGPGVLIHLKKQNGDSEQVRIEISETLIAGNRVGVWISGLQSNPTGVVRFLDSEIRGFKVIQNSPELDVSFVP